PRSPTRRAAGCAARSPAGRGSAPAASATAAALPAPAGPGPAAARGRRRGADGVPAGRCAGAAPQRRPAAGPGGSWWSSFGEEAVHLLRGGVRGLLRRVPLSTEEIMVGSVLAPSILP